MADDRRALANAGMTAGDVDLMEINEAFATLLHALQAKDKQVGPETMCAAGGQGMAMVIERLSL